jgi:hypothetical protein
MHTHTHTHTKQAGRHRHALPELRVPAVTRAAAQGRKRFSGQACSHMSDGLNMHRLPADVHAACLQLDI